MNKTIKVIAAKLNAFWNMGRPFLRSWLLFAAKCIHTIYVWTHNWIRANWQAGRNGRIKVAISGVVVMVLIGWFFNSGDNPAKESDRGWSEVSRSGDNAVDIDNSGSNLSEESYTKSCLDGISMQDYAPDGNEDGEYVERVHGHSTATANCGNALHFQLRALPNGGYNYLVYRYWEHRGWSARDGNGEISLVVFNDANAFDAFISYKQAVQKARKWIELGRENDTTISGFKDMNIDVPDGCAVKIPNAADKWMVFSTVADISSHKKARTRLEFSFSSDHRCLRLNCGDIYVDHRWQSKEDEKELTALESACNLAQLFSLFKGRNGESDALRMSQEYGEIPVVEANKKLPKWECGDICTMKDFPGNLTVTLSKREDDPYNYIFTPYRTNDRHGILRSQLLIFPRDSYDLAYEAIERAFRVALAWRQTAKEHRILNLVKEIEIPCPDSVPVEIVGMENYKKRWWEALDKFYPQSAGKRTRFWFSIETDARPKNGKYVYKSENTRFYLYFGCEGAVKCLILDDQTIAAFKLLNPQLALEKFRGKLNSEKIFD